MGYGNWEGVIFHVVIFKVFFPHSLRNLYKKDHQIRMKIPGSDVSGKRISENGRVIL